MYTCYFSPYSSFTQNLLKNKKSCSLFTNPKWILKIREEGHPCSFYIREKSQNFFAEE